MVIGRCHSAQVGLPGGCNLGQRPIDQHIKGFELLGANVDVSQGKITANSDDLVGTSIYFDVVSVGATESSQNNCPTGSFIGSTVAISNPIVCAATSTA